LISSRWGILSEFASQPLILWQIKLFCMWQMVNPKKNRRQLLRRRNSLGSAPFLNLCQDK